MPSIINNFPRLNWLMNKKQKKIISFFVLLSFILTINQFPSNTTNGFQVIQSDYENRKISASIDGKSDKSNNIEREAIEINSNYDFVHHASIEGWEGNGTETNPFLIKEYNITSGYDLIRITNSNVYFQIKNCCLVGEGEGIGILFSNVSNGHIVDNVIYNHTTGIAIRSSSKENTISENQFSDYSDVGIQLEESSEFNVVKLNDFLHTNENSTHTIDNGFSNTIVFNYWSDWIIDLNADGIVDTPFLISGTSKNNDTHPLSAPNPPKTQLLSIPKIVTSIDQEILKGSVVLRWTESVDSFGYDVFYRVCFSKDYRIWKPLASDIQTTSYSLNTRTLDDGSNYWLRIQSYCSESGMLNEVFFGSFSVQNIYTPEIRFLASLLLLAIAASILIGAIYWRYRTSSIEQTKKIHSELEKLRLRISYGSFTDEGLVIRGKSKRCNFDDQQLQSMLEYSAMLYQYGKIGEMYGPFPLTNEKRTNKEPTTDEKKWNYISLWIKMIDDSIEDLRITKRTGEVPTGILLFFQEKFESLITSKKVEITGILTKEFKRISKISDITTSLLNEIEDEIFARISS